MKCTKSCFSQYIIYMTILFNKSVETNVMAQQPYATNIKCQSYKALNDVLPLDPHTAIWSMFTLPWTGYVLLSCVERPPCVCVSPSDSEAGLRSSNLNCRAISSSFSVAVCFSLWKCDSSGSGKDVTFNAVSLFRNGCHTPWMLGLSVCHIFLSLTIGTPDRLCR